MSDEAFPMRATEWRRGKMGATKYFALVNEVYKLIFDLTDGMSWPMSFQAALLSSTA